jgi:hypothetical protein
VRARDRKGRTEVRFDVTDTRSKQELRMKAHECSTARPVVERVGVAGRLLTMGMIAVGCAQTARTTTNFDPSTNFSGYRTYSWRAASRVDRGPMDERITRSVDRELQRKGLVQVPQSGDLEVSFFVSVDQRLDISWDDLNSPYWSFWDRRLHGQTTAREVPEGTIVVDLFDGRKNRLVWRGVSVDELDAETGDLETRISFVTAEMFQDFPPRTP